MELKNFVNELFPIIRKGKIKMGNLTFPNGVKDYNYEKYGIYIPLLYYTSNILSELHSKWYDESRMEHFDNRYKNKREYIVGLVDKNTRKIGKVKGSVSKYLSGLMWSDYPLDSFVYNMSQIILDLDWIISQISEDNEVKIGKYKIEHHGGFFGFNDDNEAIVDEYRIYCKNELIFAIGNGTFGQCIEKIIEYAGGFESWKMLE